MRAHTIPSLPKTVLSYNIGEKAAALDNIAARLGIKHVIIPLDKAGESIGYLAGYKGFSQNNSSESTDAECVILSGFSSADMNELLRAMRSDNVIIPLKAVVTEHNQNKSVKWLTAELQKERAAIEAAKK